MIEDLYVQAKDLYEKACEPEPIIDPDDITGFLGQFLDEADIFPRLEIILRKELENATNWDDRYNYYAPFNVDELITKIKQQL